MNKEVNQEIKNIILEILMKMSIDNVSIEIKQKDDKTIFNISTNDSALLIGRAGENLSALGHIVYIMLARKITDVPFFMIDVNNYRQDKIQNIINLVENTVSRVEQSKRNELLMPMTSYERKLVHTFIAEKYKNLESISIGEKPNRRVLIKLVS